MTPNDFNKIINQLLWMYAIKFAGQTEEQAKESLDNYFKWFENEVKNNPKYDNEKSI